MEVKTTGLKKFEIVTELLLMSQKTMRSYLFYHQVNNYTLIEATLSNREGGVEKEKKKNLFRLAS